MNGRQPSSPGSSKKMLGVTFDVADPLEKELYMYVHQKTDNFSQLVKHLLFAWRYGYQQAGGNKTNTPDPVIKKNEIQNSGLPFG